MQRKREKVELYEERMEIISREFPVIALKGFMIRGFITGLGIPFL
jgi:hypothetical protein